MLSWLLPYIPASPIMWFLLSSSIINIKYTYYSVTLSGTMKFEGIEMSVPKNPEAWLTEQYGYLGPDCMYDQKTHKYYKRPTTQ